MTTIRYLTSGEALAELSRTVRSYERRYGVKSEEMARQIREGERAGDAAISSWLVKWRALEHLRSH